MVLLDEDNAVLATDPAQTGRLARFSQPQDWNGTETFPGVLSTTDTFHYQTFSIAPVFAGVATPFLQITMTDPSTTTDNTFAAAYDDQYLPNSSSSGNLGFDANWLGDAGFSSTHNVPVVFQVVAPSSGNVIIEVNTVGPAALGALYHLKVEGFVDANFTEPSAPEPAAGAILVFASTALTRRRSCKH